MENEKVEVVETEDMKAKFTEKLKELLEIGKKKRNILEYSEISDFFNFGIFGFFPGCTR